MFMNNLFVYVNERASFLSVKSSFTFYMMHFFVCNYLFGKKMFIHFRLFNLMSHKFQKLVCEQNSFVISTLIINEPSSNMSIFKRVKSKCIFELEIVRA